MIIGLTGKNAAGKGVAAEYLISKGFIYYSLSDELREILKEKGKKPTRENLILLGNELREKHGPNYLAQRINNKIKKQPEKSYVVDSIRNPLEIEELRKNDSFLLLGIDANIKKRFQRSLIRGREGDAKTLKEFIMIEEKENTNNAASQQLNNCFNMSDKVIDNNSSIEELHEKIKKIIDEA